MKLTNEAVLKKLQAGEYNIDRAGHTTNDPVRTMIGELEHLIDLSKDPQFSESFIELKSIRQVGDFLDCEIYCFDCGHRYSPVLKDENTWVLVDRRKCWDIKKLVAEGKEVPWEEYEEQCSFAPHKEKGFFEQTLFYPTGEILINDHFGEELKDPQDIDYVSINALAGRLHHMQEFQKENVGYGQMGNMYFDVFLHKDKNSMIFSSEYVYDGETDEETKTEFPGYEIVGNVCCDVWRWMCIDQQLAIERNLPVRESTLKLNVQPGTWRVEHYYDLLGDESPNNIYTEFTLIPTV